MAEIFGTAASVLQVAEAGASLATTLYNYAKSVKSAEKDIKKIAREVSLTAAVLQHTHDHLKGQSDVQTCSERAIHDLEDLLAGCKEAFQEVDDALTKSMRPGANGSFTISVAEKLKWPLRSTKLEVLRAHLEKLKSTLLLMLTVLALGSKIARRRAAPAGENVDLTLDRLQIQSLINAKEDAADKYAELTEAFPNLEKDVGGGAATAGSTTAADQPDLVMPLVLPPLDTPKGNSQDSHLIGDNDDMHPVVANLELCASAVSRLTSSIDAATKQWHSHQVLEHEPIATSLREASHTIRLLKENGCRSPKLSTHPENPGYTTKCSVRTGTARFKSRHHLPRDAVVEHPRPLKDDTSSETESSDNELRHDHRRTKGRRRETRRIADSPAHPKSRSRRPQDNIVEHPRRPTTHKAYTVSASPARRPSRRVTDLSCDTSDLENYERDAIDRRSTSPGEKLLMKHTLRSSVASSYGTPSTSVSNSTKYEAIIEGPNGGRRVYLSKDEVDALADRNARQTQQEQARLRIQRERVTSYQNGSTAGYQRQSLTANNVKQADRTPVTAVSSRSHPSHGSGSLAVARSRKLQGHARDDSDSDSFELRVESQVGSGRIVRGTWEEGEAIVEAGADGGDEGVAVEDLLRMWTTVAA